MKKYLIIFLAIILLLIPGFWFGGRWILSFSTADYEGEIEVNDVRNQIEITFDQKGIPQIWALNNQDLYFALGWLHASERLFQMELVRRFTGGELSEIFGRVAYPVDLSQRRMGFVRKAKEDFKELDLNVVGLLQSYCNGINAWINYKDVLPPEFVLLQLSPREWIPLDCLSIALYQTWYAHSLMNKDYQYYQLIEDFGEKIQQLLAETKDWSPPTVHDSFTESYFGSYLSPPTMTFASNSWVIAPEKSASGQPIHASDPHLMINQIPGFWYIVGMHSKEGINSLGVTAPGLPFIAMGHTDKIAYAFTVASVDLVDYYIQKRNPDDSLQVLTGNGYDNMTLVNEEIKIKDLDHPRTETFYTTPLGVVVENDTDKVVSLKWAGYDFNAADILNSALTLPSVDNFEDFRGVVTSLGALDVNWTYSDINGNIGYQLGTPIPRRDYTNTFTRLEADNPANYWKGYYPLDQTPHMINPQEGWLASCNNQIVSEEWPYKIPGFYDPYRIVRINELLKPDAKFTRSEILKMQLDWVSISARRWKGLMQEGAQRLNMPDLVDTINRWDGVMFKHGKLPALFALWWGYLAHPIFSDDLGDNWRLGQIIQEEVLTDTIETIIDNLDTPGVRETLSDISAIALDSAFSNLNNRMYGDVSQLHISHPLSQLKLLDYWLDLNRGPYEMGGDFSSLNANLSVYEPAKKQFSTLVGPSMRFVLDWAEIDSFSIILNLGQSGNPFSPHYDDFFDLWQNGEPWIVPFSKEKVYESRKTLLRLIPKTEE